MKSRRAWEKLASGFGEDSPVHWPVPVLDPHGGQRLTGGDQAAAGHLEPWLPRVPLNVGPPVCPQEYEMPFSAMITTPGAAGRRR